VEELLKYALAEHPSLRARHHEVAAARARLISAGLLPNPQLVVDTESPVHRDGPTELEARVTFEILTGGKRRLRQAVAESGIRRAQAALSRETELVLLEAADAAIETLYWQELVQLTTRLAEIAAERAKLGAPDFDNRGSEFRLADAVEAECDAAAAETARLEAQNRLTAARLRLSSALGMFPPVLPEVTGTIEADGGPLISLDEVLALARRDCPQLSEARATLSESRRQQELACAERLPDLTLGPRVRDRLGEADDEVGARFGTDLPLFDRNRGRILESAAQVQASRARLAEAELTALGDVAEAFLELQSLHEALAQHGPGIMDRVERYEALLRDPAVQQGMSRNQALELLQQLVETRIRHLDLRYRYLRLRARLELILGNSVCRS
jgi:cobalt-zinc-cadmium efflux system outer membrane protein